MVVFRKFCGLLLPVAMMFLLNSCASFHMVNRPLTKALEKDEEYILVVWDSQIFEMRQAQVEDDVLTGVMRRGDLSKKFFSNEEVVEIDEESGEVFIIESLADTEFLDFDYSGSKPQTHEVQILVSNEYPLPPGYSFNEPREASIPLDHITEVQVRELNAGLTIVKTFGGMVLTAGIVFLIIMATKDSCPFIYVMEGEDAHLVGEIYSGAIHPPLERHDYMPLPISGDGPCQLKITNEVLEIQHTNLVELLVFDHDPAERVLLDRHGSAHLIEQPVLPVVAKTYGGTDLLSLITVDDGAVYEVGLGDTPENETGLDGMVVTFDRDPNADTMQLLVNARNSRWLDHVLGMIFEQMGDMFKPWQEAQKSGSTENMMRWSQEQGLPLTVSLLTPDGWQYVDYIDLVGPIASRESVVGIDIGGIPGDQVSVKIECGYRFWEVDSIKASFVAGEAPQGTTVTLDHATNQDGLDVRGALIADDDKYLHQPDFTDVTLMDFTLPVLEQGMSRSVILHSRGHYDILRDPTGLPEASFLATMTRPAAVPAYSRDMYRALSHQAGN